ncbi:MAG: bifunctional proline dehydrogenase/L-glutamate gamma-semialdehyde dehydrogenase [Rhodocyclaceae bacterium]|nr:bifunctional proline dehydrogenase/L-glutamate gamma-semialdehyde dehydrogenase [Rhodocyclaceae bacterium]
MSTFETEVRTVGRCLYERAAGRRPDLYRGFAGSLLKATLADTHLRDGLFQLVDVLPQLSGSTQVAQHLAAYLRGVRHTGWQGRLLALAARPALAWGVRLAVRRLARRFLAEETEAGVLAVLDRLARLPAQATLDAVGEAVLSDAEADAYLARTLQLLEWQGQRGVPHLSLKLTALTARFDPLDTAGTRRRVFARLEPLLAAAARHTATVTVDMEHYELKPLILDLFLDMAAAFPGDWRPALALQAYLPDSATDVQRVYAAAQTLGRCLGVRLVKGAYWDQEAAWAAQRGWPQPTFADKATTDAAFENLTGWLLERSDTLHPAIASHNLRSQAVALAHARRRGLAAERWEAQMLFGMAEPLRDALVAEGVSLRVYVPTGDLVGGIAYLIRRLIENTASTSVLRQAYVEGADVAALLAPPLAQTSAASAVAPGLNLPLLDFSQAPARDGLAQALRALRAERPRRHVLAIRGCAAAPAALHEARNPARPDECLGEVEIAGIAHAQAAVANARTAFAGWRDTPVAERCRILRRAAERIERRRGEFAALEVLESAKPWREADADVAEAVDFLRYYAGEMEKLAGWQTTRDFPGETNAVAYRPRGVAVVIAPWNFPLAILAGMSAAALVAGNAVIMKPALPALLVAHALRDLLHAAGVPADALQLVPGEREIGSALVAHADVQLIAFTGSRSVGLEILQAAHTLAPGQRHVKQVVCEMGGKNAIVVDADADLDEAVTGILASAFGYSGQKCSACSRVIAVAAIHDRLLDRLVAAAASLAWGPPEDPACDHGPLISAAARDKAQRYVEIGRREGRLVWQGRVPQDGGWYVAPAIFADIRPEHRLAREEVFGPLLAVLRAADFATALQMAMDSDYALSGGVYSRLPEHLAQARECFCVGNLYLNRRITGARVGIQPFGGVALSGTGVQAGGADYLKQFLWSRCVSTNTQRRAFLPAANEVD